MIPITIDQITKRFGTTVALDAISLRIEPGELFFLLGPSGCGKTTLLRSIAGFVLPDNGRVLFGDDDVTRQPPHQRNTGMMFQSYALWPHMTVARNVAFGLEERRLPKGEIAQRVSEALDAVRMSEFGERRIHQLSGGQQQRVALARAMVIRPRCLLLDEPLSNLDAKLRLEMRQEIRRVCKAFGLTAIYVTHDMKEALSVSDRLAILHRGRIEQCGPPAEVYRRPRTQFAADFMGETNFIAATVRSIDSDGVQFETALGRFRSAHAGEPLAIGQKRLLSIRPEAWTLSETATAENSVAGHLAERTYLGEMAQYAFLTGTHHLKVYEVNPRYFTQSETRTLHASVDPEDVVPVVEDAA